MKPMTSLPALLAIACSAGLVLSGLYAQENQPRNTQRNAETQEAARNLRPGGFRMTIPPERGAIEIVAEAPAEARVNSQIEYRITLRNVTENLMLHEIVLAEAQSGTTSIESVTLEGRQGQNARQRNRGQQDQNRQNRNQPGQNPQEQDEQDQNQQDQNQDPQPAENQAQDRNQNQDESQNPDRAQRRNQRQGQAQNRNQAQRQGQGRGGNQQGLTSSGDGEWTLAQLGPGQSKTLLVRASAGEEGQAMTCLTVKSWQPAICLMTEVVKPEIQITKKAPERASLCEPFEIEYTITNPGTGDIEAFTLRDPLPEGLKLVDDKQEIAYEVDGLKAGDTRSFVARVIAERPGEYRSRAEAVAGENLQARSAETTTSVIAAQLAVEIEGPSQTYINRNMTYTAFVTNAGEAPARNASLQIQLPQESLRMIDVGSLRRSDRRVEAGQRPTGAEAEPMPAEASADQNQNQNRNQNQQRNQDQNQNQPQLAAAETIEIGDLAPGESRQVAFVVRAAQDGTFPIQAQTTFVCGDRPEDRTQSVAQTQVEVLSLAALAIGVADEQDPVPVGKQVSYVVSVINEGTAADQNIRVTAQLPQNYEFVEGNGQTEVTNEGGTIEFAPVDSLGPGDKAEWNVTLQAKQPGNVRFEIDVQSDKSADNVTAAEPTTLFQEN